MNKLRLLTLLFAAIIFTTLTGCNKDKDAEPTRNDLLTSQSWKGKAIYANGQLATEDFIEVFNYDITKSTLKFDKKGTYADTYDRNTISGTWEFTSNEQKVLFDKGDPDYEYTADITKLDGQELWLQETLDFEDGNGDPQSLLLEIRYSH